MEIDYVTDRSGNKYKTIVSLEYGAVITTAILPERRPIDIFCISPDGCLFSKLRDSDFRGFSSSIRIKALKKIDEAYEEGLFLPNVDEMYGYAHPSNVASIRWATSLGGRLDSVYEIEGVEFNKFVVPVKDIINSYKKYY